MARLLTVVGAIAVGVFGVMVFYWALNKLVEQLPETWEERIKPYIFVAPAVFVVTLFLVYPAIRTVYLSFFGARSAEFVGLANYQRLVTDSGMLITLRNTIAWVIVVPALAVLIGLVVAVLADKLTKRWESVSKSMIFMPMAISFVGASTIWSFVYAFRPPPRPQIGLLNGIRFDLFGMDPIGWLIQQPWNNFYLMVILVWMQAGFAMVLLSAAIKNVPEDTLEAARIDGANEWQVFTRVVVPQIKGTIFVVTTTILILVMKIFDIVFVTTQGNFGTDVVAHRFYTELFVTRNFGMAATLVTVLLIAVIPVMVMNIRRFREEEAYR